MTNVAGSIAVNRFGLGAMPGELSAAAGDPRGWLLDQLRPAELPPVLAALPASPPLYQRFKELRADLKAERQRDGTAADAPPTSPERSLREELRAPYMADAAARTRVAATTSRPFAERLVQFWSNHFTVSIARPVVAPLAGAFEREAIRPHIGGRFIDLLRAVVSHPAMLLYLDNAMSLGPDSIAGQRRGKGQNENLARELLELHTLGVDGGYGQADVEQLASILTGWTIGTERQGIPGEFLFQPRFHQPGDKRLLGTLFREAGEAEGEQALAMLAAHPSTAHFIATKLVRHFVADDPPPAAVAAVAKVYGDTGGDLTALGRAVVERPEAWAAPLSKIKNANEFAVSAWRLLGVPPLEDVKLVRALGVLGQAPFAAPSPAGWPDRAEAWMGPEQLMRRLEWARSMGRWAAQADIAALAEQAFGPLLGAATRQAIAQAGDGSEAVLMLLASPEFLRR